MQGELARPLLQVGFRRYEGEFASGQQSNNKLELDYRRLSQYPELLGQVTMRLCELVEPYDLDFVIGVPDGAIGLATRVAQELDLYNPWLKKDKVTGKFSYATEVDRDSVINYLSRGALIEDVLNLGTNTRKALQVEGLNAKVQVIAAVFNRGKESWRKHSPIEQPTLSVAGQPIRPKLWRYSRLWQYAS
jgi:orotate phosphoribosyltransferase